jgi:SAM-dependent methyltransferase
MLFISRMPSEKQLNNFYQSYATFKGYSTTANRSKALTWMQCAAHCSQNPYIEFLEETGGIFGRSLLDVGCSSGRFLELVRYKGGRGSGVELDGAARLEAHSRGFQVDEALPENGDFDITTSFHVLEHLPDPQQTLTGISKVTRNDGRILISVPNATEVASLGADWLGFRVDLEHINFFSIASLTEMLRRQNLLVEHYWEHRQPALIRTDATTPPARNVKERVQAQLQRLTETAMRILAPPPERFLQGTFTLTVLARKA